MTNASLSIYSRQQKPTKSPRIVNDGVITIQLSVISPYNPSLLI